MRTFLKWTAGLVLGLLILLLLAGGFLFVRGSSAASETFEIEPVNVVVQSDSASIAHGAYLTKTLACTHCHGADLSGGVFADAPPFLAVASNLTPGGEVGSYSDQELARAIRFGVRPDGSGMLIMPSELYHNLADEEVADIIAYLRTLEPIEKDLPKSELRPLGKVIAGTGARFYTASLVGEWGPRPAMPEFGPTEDWGRYRLKTLCVACHGNNLEGVQPPDPGSPLGPPLAPVKGWSRDEFGTALQQGVTPGGRELDDKYMPWTAFQHMTDQEVDALYAAIQAW